MTWANASACENAMKKTPIQQMADELVAAHPDHTARGLARMLVEKSNKATTLEQAREMIRYRLGQHGKRLRKYRPQTRKARKPGQMKKLPKSQAQPWKPVKLQGVKTVGVLADIHCPFHDVAALETAVEHLKSSGVDTVLLNGDLCDFYSISRWIKNPSQRNFQRELEDCKALLKWLRDEFSDCQLVFKVGNHEERWSHYIWQHAPELSASSLMTLQAWLELQELEIALVDNQRPVMVGKLAIFHGHELGGSSSPVSVAKGAFNKTNASIMVAHSHKTSTHCDLDVWHNVTATWSVGCLCDLRPDYSILNKWNHGAAIVRVEKNGSVDVENFRIKDRKKIWVL